MALSECSATVMNATEPRSAAPQQAKATATEHRPSVTQHTQTHGKTQGHTSGIDPNIEPLCDNTGNKAMTLPQLWPLGRPQLDAREKCSTAASCVKALHGLFRKSNILKDSLCFPHAHGVDIPQVDTATFAPRESVAQYALRVEVQMLT